MVCPEKLYQACGWKSRLGRRAGAPSSRLHPEGETPRDERSVESPSRGISPVGGERIFGPNVSEPLQPRERSAERRRGRAGHVAAKARDWAYGAGGAQDPSGVGEAARRDSLVRNRRDPPRPLTSSKDPGYKPRAKCSGAGRESEGLVVLVKLARAGGGKGPYFGHAGRRGKREGMVVRPNNPLRKREDWASRYAAVPSGRWVPVPWWRKRTGVTTCCVYRAGNLEDRACLRMKTIGQPCAGNPHARLERGPQETDPVIMTGHRA